MRACVCVWLCVVEFLNDPSKKQVYQVLSEGYMDQEISHRCYYYYYCYYTITTIIINIKSSFEPLRVWGMLPARLVVWPSSTGVPPSGP
jgi:hypothetical protein